MKLNHVTRTATEDLVDRKGHATCRRMHDLTRGTSVTSTVSRAAP
jgi:hypothetical protein